MYRCSDRKLLGLFVLSLTTVIGAEEAVTTPLIAINAGTNVRSIEFSPDGSTLLAGLNDYTAKIWEADSGTLLQTFSGHTWIVYDAQFFPDGSKVVTVSADRSAKIWDVGTGSVIRTLTGHGEEVLACAVSPDGQMIATGGGTTDHSVIVWNATTGSQIDRFVSNNGWIRDLEFTPDGSRLIVISSGQQVFVRQTGPWQTLISFTASNCLRGSVSPDGLFLLVGSLAPHTVARIWDLATGTEVQALTGHSSYVSGTAYSPNGSYALTGAGNGNEVRLWDLSSGSTICTYSGGSPSDISAVDVSPDGNRIVSAEFGGQIRVWQTPFTVPVELSAFEME